MNDIFAKFVRKEFQFLIDEYGFQIIDVEKTNYGCLVWYKNQSTVVRVSLELYDGGVFTTIYKLKDGGIPEYPVFFDPAAEFLIFDLNDLLLLRTGKKVEQDGELIYKKEYLETKVQEFAASLKKNATDVLAGDFTVLPQIKERVARRAKELEDER